MKRVLSTWISENREKTWVLADQLLLSGVNFSVGILLARLLGIEQYGVFALALMVLFFASSLHQAFLVAPLYALSAKQSDPVNWKGHLFFIQLLFSLFTLGFTWVGLNLAASLYTEWNYPELCYFLPLWIALFLFNDFVRRTLFVLHQPQKVFFADLSAYLLQPILFFLLWYAGQLTLSTILAAILLAQGISLLQLLIYGKVYFLRKGLLKTLKKLWNYSRYLLLTALLQWSSGNYFILVAGALLGPFALGAIRIAQNLMGLLHVIFLAMENLVPLRSAEIFQQRGLGALQQYTRSIFIQALGPIVLLISGISLFRQQIIACFYGEEFISYANLLLAFCIIYLLIFIGTLLRFVIRTLEMNQVIFKAYVFSTIFSLLMARLLVSTMDLMGVVLGIALTHLLHLTFFIVLLKRRTQWSIKSFISF